MFDLWNLNKEPSTGFYILSRVVCRGIMYLKIPQENTFFHITSANSSTNLTHFVLLDTLINVYTVRNLSKMFITMFGHGKYQLPMVSMKTSKTSEYFENFKISQKIYVSKSTWSKSLSSILVITTKFRF